MKLEKDTSEGIRDYPPLPLWAAISPVILLILSLTVNFMTIGMSALDGPNQITIIVCGFITILFAKICGIPTRVVSSAILNTISTALPAILIILIIGSLIASWYIGGVIPTIIYFGLDIISPRFFFLTAIIVCCLTSLAIGSSWSTTATVGIALFGVSEALHLHPGLSIGAIISGAYFGDKMSPLSDTTNLAAVSAKVPLFTHVSNMTVTTVPAIILSLVFFTIAGFYQGSSTVDADEIEFIRQELRTIYNINPILLIIPVIVGALIVRKLSVMTALIIAILLGIISAVIGQRELLNSISPMPDSPFSFYTSIIEALSVGFKIEAESQALNKVLRAGGMAGMLPTIWLILSAMVFGGALKGSGAIQRVTNAFLGFVHTRGQLIASTAGSAIFMNLTAGDHVLSIIVPSQVFASAYSRLQMAPEMMSRTLEDAGTVTSPLIPWNSCGAYQASVFGVDPLTFIPYCVFNFLSPTLSIAFGFMGIGIKKLNSSQFSEEKNAAKVLPNFGNPTQTQNGKSACKFSL